MGKRYEGGGCLVPDQKTRRVDEEEGKRENETREEKESDIRECETRATNETYHLTMYKRDLKGTEESYCCC